MNGFQDIPDIERITFFNGQRLTAEDLSALQNANRDLRWLHNRSLHGWGIGAGFSVTGEKGDTVVQVGPGYAIDCLGREIILNASVSKTVPAVSGASDGTEAVYYLLASYQDDGSQQVLESRPGVCLPGGTVRLTENPSLTWRTQANLGTPGSEVPLAQVSISNCQLSRPVSLAVRRFARISSQPYIAAGETDPSNTNWQLWQPDSSQPPLGVYVTVDTSSAQFHSTPAYTAYIAGDRVYHLDRDSVAVAFMTVSASEPTQRSLKIQAFLPESENPLLADPTRWLGIAQLQWHVVWMGVEG